MGCLRRLRRNKRLSKDTPTAVPATVATVLAVLEPFVFCVPLVLPFAEAPQLGQKFAVSSIWEPQF